jgi:U3 small nucleolar RNA-associated protein 14
MYLKWPLTLADINNFPHRRNKAYLRALDLKGSNDRKAKTYFKKVLTDFVEKAGGECARPITAPNGLAWSEWFTDQQ